MEPWTVAGIVLTAVLAGFCLPVLVQLALTLSRFRRVLDKTAPRLDDTLDELREAARRVNGMAGQLEGTERIGHLLEESGELAKTIGRIRRSLQSASAVGSAVGPAVAAALHAFAATQKPGPRDESHASHGNGRHEGRAKGAEL